MTEYCRARPAREEAAFSFQPYYDFSKRRRVCLEPTTQRLCSNDIFRPLAIFGDIAVKPSLVEAAGPRIQLEDAITLEVTTEFSLYPEKRIDFHARRLEGIAKTPSDRTHHLRLRIG